MEVISSKKVEKSYFSSNNTNGIYRTKTGALVCASTNSESNTQSYDEFSKKAGEAITKNRICEVSFKGNLPTKVFESLNFVPAKTLEEAEQYALKVLGLQSVDYHGELPFANWTNEAFTALVNKFEGRGYLPDSLSVKPYEKGHENTLAIHCGGNITVFSRAIEDSAIRELDGLLGSWCLDPSQKGKRNFLHALYPKEVVQRIDGILTKYSSSGKIDLKSALIAYDFGQDFSKNIREVCDHPDDIFAKIFKGLNSKNMLQITQKDGVYIVILKEDHGKTAKEIRDASYLLTEQVNRIMANKPADDRDNFVLLKIMGDVLGEKGIYLSSIDSVEKMPMSFDTVFHECGHFVHETYHSRKSYDLMRYYHSYQAHFLHYRDKIRRLLTERAALNSDEYVAERFKFKARGIEFNDPDIKELDEFLEVE